MRRTSPLTATGLTLASVAALAGCGVFDWDPPAALVVELSDLLAGKVQR